jgi:hypothetical protein
MKLRSDKASASYRVNDHLYRVSYDHECQNWSVYRAGLYHEVRGGRENCFLFETPFYAGTLVHAEGRSTAIVAVHKSRPGRMGGRVLRQGSYEKPITLDEALRFLAYEFLHVQRVNEMGTAR